MQALIVEKIYEWPGDEAMIAIHCMYIHTCSYMWENELLHKHQLLHSIERAAVYTYMYVDNNIVTIPHRLHFSVTVYDYSTYIIRIGILGILCIDSYSH